MEVSSGIGLIQSNPESSDMIVDILLNYGIPSIKIDPSSNDTPQIPDNIKFLFVDMDFSDNQGIKILDKISDKNQPFPYLTIGTSFNPTSDMITELQKFNLVSFIVKPLTADVLKLKFRNIMEKFSDHFPTRQHIRIKPETDEAVRVNFRFNEKYYSCKVIDISLGGLAAEVYSNSGEHGFSTGDTIDEIFINIGVREIALKALFVSVKSNFISLKFINFQENSYDILSKYILKKISD